MTAGPYRIEYTLGGIHRLVDGDGNEIRRGTYNQCASRKAALVALESTRRNDEPSALRRAFA